MKLIVDSGSTKAVWAFTNMKNQRTYIRTAGVNPYVNDLTTMLSVISKKLAHNQRLQTSIIHYYGSGAKDPMKESLNSFLTRLFPNCKQIEINSDLLGSARALFRDEKGIVCILGTGSNAAFYDGEKLHQIYPSLGYILGDEGGGFHLGKMILKDYFENRLNRDQKSLFVKIFKPSEDLLAEIYKSDRINREIGKYSMFLSQCDEDYRNRKLRESFLQFFEISLKAYHEKYNLPVGFCGSIAVNYKENLLEICEEFGIQVAGVIENPIANLLNYHFNV